HPMKSIRIVRFRADVAELADAQASEACDGDIVEVQVLSSAPRMWARQMARPFCFVNNVPRWISPCAGALRQRALRLRPQTELRWARRLALSPFPLLQYLRRFLCESWGQYCAPP